MTKRQVTITLHRFDDRGFVTYVENLFNELFKIKPSIYERKNTINIVVSRTKLVQFLTDMGFCVGSKVKQQVNVPTWIEESELFTKSCLRGLFDTDGCFFVDKHRHKDKVYYNCGMNFTNRSLPLLSFFRTKLEQFGFNLTVNNEFCVFLRRENQIIRYFREIRSSNPKHLDKFKKYFKKKRGEVPKLVIPARFRKPMVTM